MEVKIAGPYYCDECAEDAAYTIIVERENREVRLCLKHKLELVTLLTSGPPVQAEDAEHRASKRSEA